MFGDISNDKKIHRLRKAGHGDADSDVYLYNIETKEMKNLTAHTGEVGNSPQTFDVESKYLYFLTDEGSEFSIHRPLRSRDRQTRGRRESAVGRFYTYFSRNGKYRVVAINEDARTKIKIYETATGKLVDCRSCPTATSPASTSRRARSVMAFYLNGDRSPGESARLQLRHEEGRRS